MQCLREGSRSILGQVSTCTAKLTHRCWAGPSEMFCQICPQASGAPLPIGTEAGNGKQFQHLQPGVLPFTNTLDVHTWSLGCCCWGPSVEMASCLIKWWYASFTGTWNGCQTKRVWFYFYYSEFKAHANSNPHFNTVVVPVKPSFFPLYVRFLPRI